MTAPEQWSLEQMRAMSKLTVGAVLLVSCPVEALAGEGVVALQTAAPSCPTYSPEEIYHPCGNGTVTDNRTGLVWVADAGCIGYVDWSTALEFVAGLKDGECGLTDGSSPGEWRLPSIAEWETMIADARTFGCTESALGGPTITNDFGTACWTDACPPSLCSFSGVQAGPYWSATSSLGSNEAWMISLHFGDLVDGDKDSVRLVWAVRGGR
jgi:hypothetical protein